MGVSLHFTAVDQRSTAVLTHVGRVFTLASLAGVSMHASASLRAFFPHTRKHVTSDHAPRCEYKREPLGGSFGVRLCICVQSLSRLGRLVYGSIRCSRLGRTQD